MWILQKSIWNKAKQDHKKADIILIVTSINICSLKKIRCSVKWLTYLKIKGHEYILKFQNFARVHISDSSLPFLKFFSFKWDFCAQTLQILLWYWLFSFHWTLENSNLFGQEQAENSPKWQPLGSQMLGLCCQNRFWLPSFYRVLSYLKLLDTLTDEAVETTKSEILWSVSEILSHWLTQQQVFWINDD